MWSLIPFPWKAAGIGGLVLLAGLAVWQVREGVKNEGRREVLSDVNRTNQEASDAARKAREAHDLACARHEPQCLRDGWTRDGDR
ncbi:MAG: hypothetical protein Q8O26_08300 [Phreatobacter sp.]|uniref:hypothetical protein n=1 Tax=Phreatobacter sp. TaxID=1966341 RepID=UPI0027362772|nr:hypothetical protein [Phreatobacter sp.]MDP2801868.1 hypothetical protein [Phreatobacter sp.]